MAYDEDLRQKNLRSPNPRSRMGIRKQREMGMRGRTTMDEGHVHDYFIHPDGRVVIYTARHPMAPNEIHHDHKVSGRWPNIVIHGGQSDCWKSDKSDPQSCTSRYGHEGAGPHGHEISVAGNKNTRLTSANGSTVDYRVAEAKKRGGIK